jgi:hypothetical protein
MKNPAGQFLDQTLEQAKAGGKALGLQIQPHYVKGAEDIGRAFDELKKLRVNALLVLGGPVMDAQFTANN